MDWSVQSTKVRPLSNGARRRGHVATLYGSQRKFPCLDEQKYLTRTSIALQLGARLTLHSVHGKSNYRARR